MYTYKKIEFGFVVLCPERNFGGLRATIKTAKSNYPDATFVIVVPEITTQKEIADFQQFAPVVIGKDTYTSLINAGIKESLRDWNFIIFAGCSIRHRLYHKYAYFIEDEKDVMFPIAERKYSFVDGTLNGILIHKNALKEVGDFAEGKVGIEEAKMFWALEAMDKGYKFKALAGAKII